MRTSPATTLLTRVHHHLPTLYLLLALTLSTLLTLLTPPFFAPDEPHHAARTIALAHGTLVVHPRPGEAGALIDSNALRAMDRMDDIREAAERRSSNFLNRPWGPFPDLNALQSTRLHWSGQTAFAPFPNTAVYPPTLYLPAALGWRIAEAANLTMQHSLWLARLLAAFTAAFLGWLALRLCACSRFVLLPFLILPSTLFLNASCSQDSVLLSLAALIVALLSRALAAHRLFTHAELATLAALIAICATARPPYLGLALILFLPSLEPASPGQTVRTPRRWLAPALAFTAILALCALWRHLVYALGVDPDEGADPTLQALFLRTHPFTGAWVLLKAVAVATADFFTRGIYVVGWDDLLAPRILSLTLLLALAVIIVYTPAFPLRSWRTRTLLALAVAAPLFGIALAEYLIWTPPGNPVVYGIQPRYWLAVMPFATLLLATLKPSFRPRPVPLLVAATTLVVLACTLPCMVAHAFYLHTVAHVLHAALQ